MKTFLRRLLGKRNRGRNTRRFKRFRISYLVKYQINGKGEPRITNARDIGAGGLKFWTKEEIPAASLLKVSVFLPPLERTMEAEARVLRVRRVKGQFVYSVAVSFMDVKGEDREALQDFAEALSKDKDGRFLIDHASVVIRKSTAS